MTKACTESIPNTAQLDVIAAKLMRGDPLGAGEELWTAQLVREAKRYRAIKRSWLNRMDLGADDYGYEADRFDKDADELVERHACTDSAINDQRAKTGG